jgi:hypothetical protein
MHPPIHLSIYPSIHSFMDQAQGLGATSPDDDAYELARKDVGRALARCVKGHALCCAVLCCAAVGRGGVGWAESAHGKDESTSALCV